MPIPPNALNMPPEVINKINNPPLKAIVLPVLVMGQLAHSMGSEKNTDNQVAIAKQSIISWLISFLLINKSMPNYVFPLTALPLAIYKMAQKPTLKEKEEVFVNHACWWTCGLAMRNLSKLLEVSTGLSQFLGFAVGASVVGPVVAKFIKNNILPLINKDDPGKKNNNFNINTNKTAPKSPTFNGKIFNPIFDSYEKKPPKFDPKKNYDPADPKYLSHLIH